MIARRGTFIKTNGDRREMNFVRVSDLTEDFIEANTSGGNPPPLAEGQELVWDLDVSGFRVFNWNTVVGDVVEYALPQKGTENS